MSEVRFILFIQYGMILTIFGIQNLICVVNFIIKPIRSSYYGEEIPPLTNAEDTLRRLYAYPRKIEGLPWNDNNTSGQISDDVYVYRLAETYLCGPKLFEIINFRSCG